MSLSEFEEAFELIKTGKGCKVILDPFLNKKMSMNENKLNITIQLDGKKFPMQIADDEQTEIVYRQAAEKVNELILKYKTNYELSKDDILSMVAFHTTVNYLLLKKDRKEDTVEIAKDLQEINHLLDVYLADKEVL